jgi:uncharacterized protein YggE
MGWTDNAARLSRIAPATLFALCSLTIAAKGQQPATPPLITVTGQAEVRVPPDEVV